MRLGEPDESGRRRPEPVPGPTSPSRPTRPSLAIGQQPRLELAEWIPGLVLEHGVVKIDPETGETTNAKFFAGGDAVNGGVSAVEAVQTPSGPRRRSTSGCDERPHRDPLARASRTGREDGVPGPGAGAAALGQVSCRRSRNTARSAAAHRCAPTPAPRACRFAVTTPSSTRTQSSCSSRRLPLRRIWSRASRPTES